MAVVVGLSSSLGMADLRRMLIVASRLRALINLLRPSLLMEDLLLVSRLNQRKKGVGEGQGRKRRGVPRTRGIASRQPGEEKKILSLLVRFQVHHLAKTRLCMSVDDEDARLLRRRLH